jgi:hypothetical protein
MHHARRWSQMTGAGSAATAGAAAAAAAGQADYRPFALSGQALEDDWVGQLDLTGAKAFAPSDNSAPPK